MVTDWDLYRVFLAVARSGSFTDAAAQLQTSAQTVSRRIAQLEENIGLKLFIRTRDSFALSTVGERLLVDAEQIARATLRAEAMLASIKGEVRGTVRLSISETISGPWLVPHLPELNRAFPDIEIELLVDGWPVSVRQREADIVLRLFGPGSENLVGRKIGRIGAGFYASDAYVARHGLPGHPSEWSQHTLVNLTSTTPLAVWSTHVGRDAKSTVRCSSPADVVSAIRAGLGIGPCMCVWGNAQPGFIRIAPEKLHRTADIWLLTHPDLQEAPAVRAVMDFIRAVASTDRIALEGRA